MIRQRLSLEQFDALRLVLLRALRAHGLLKGRHLGIDSRVMEASARLRELQHRNSEQRNPLMLHDIVNPFMHHDKATHN